ncbi:Protein kinase domain-containing protein [Psidium guajava]|nr:Protein kinase domain-containing protein [Psidium guajava]
MDWTRGRAVGRGASATVSLATCRHSGDIFAVKSAELVRSNFLQREQQTLSSLSSPRIVSYRGCEITNEDGRIMFNIFMEYLPRGSLADQIRSRGGELDESAIRVYTRQILEGLYYLHSRGIAHCDVKSSNVLIGDDGGAKIADFGCAKRVGGAEIGGTPMFMAPEAARGEEQGLAGDAWAVGCTVVEMATGKSPWQSGAASDPVSVLYRIACSGESPAIPGCLSAEGRDFVSKCLRRDPRERWTVGQLLEHPFLEDHKLGSSQSEQTKTKSPTSILDQEFWNAMDETESSEAGTTGDGVESALDRIRTLSFREGRPGGRCGECVDEGWITVRLGEREGEMVEGFGTVGGSVMDCASSSSWCTSRVRAEMDASAVGGERWAAGLPGGNAGRGIRGNSYGWGGEECVVISSALDFREARKQIS